MYTVRLFLYYSFTIINIIKILEVYFQTIISKIKEIPIFLPKYEIDLNQAQYYNITNALMQFMNTNISFLATSPNEVLHIQT